MTDKNTLHIPTRNCKHLSYVPALYDIFSIENDQLQIGSYIANVNYFDGMGKSKPEFRSNVISGMSYIKLPEQKK